MLVALHSVTIPESGRYSSHQRKMKEANVMKKVMSVIAGLLLILGVTSAVIQAGEMNQDKDAAVASDDQGEMKSAAETGEADEQPAEADEDSKQAADEGEHSAEMPSDKSGH